MLELIKLPDLAPGNVARPPRWFRPRRMYCSVTNETDGPAFVYGPRHESAKASVPTSLYILHSGQHTPKFWDCKGVLVPLGMSVRIRHEIVTGPVVLKYRDFRRTSLRCKDGETICSRPDGILGPEQSHFAVPLLTCAHIMSLSRRPIESQ